MLREYALIYLPPFNFFTNTKAFWVKVNECFFARKFFFVPFYWPDEINSLSDVVLILYCPIRCQKNVYNQKLPREKNICEHLHLLYTL